jgi:hypothetical protein
MEPTGTISAKKLQKTNDYHHAKLCKVVQQRHMLQPPSVADFEASADFNTIFAFDDLHKHVSIEEIALRDGYEQALLTTQPDCLDGTSNGGEVFAADFVRFGREWLNEIPIRTDQFSLLREQRLMIAELVNTRSEDVYVHQIVDPVFWRGLGKRKVRPETRVELEKQQYPTFKMLKTPPGSGKTMMACMAAMVMLTAKWETLRRDYHTMLRKRQLLPDSGVLSGPSVKASSLARLAIIHVPTTMVEHWKQTALSCIAGFRDLAISTRIRVWTSLEWNGTGTRMRKKSTETILNAYTDGEAGIATLWIVPFGVIRDRILQQTPEFGVALEIYDEVNGNLHHRKGVLISPTLTSIVANATPASLRDATKGQPDHPLRKAFNGQNFQPVMHLADHLEHEGAAHRGYYGREREEMARRERLGSLTGKNMASMQLWHYVLLRLFSAPQFLDVAMQRSVIRHMPSGIDMYRIAVRVGTMAQLLNGSKFAQESFPELIRSMMAGLDETLTNEIVNVFLRAGSLQSEALFTNLDTLIESMSEMDAQQTRAKRSLTRIKDRFKAFFKNDLPDDPITMEPVKPENAMIMQCCTAIMDKESVVEIMTRGNKLCPLCRAHITSVFEFPQPVAEAEEEEPPPDSPVVSIPEVPYSPRSEMSDASIDVLPPSADARDAFGAVCGKTHELQTSTGDALKAVVTAQLEEKPNSRIIVAMTYNNVLVDGRSTSVRSAMASASSIVACPVDRIFDVDNLANDAKKVGEAVALYKSDDDKPVVFILNTKPRSPAVSGLDLPNTDLTILSDGCSAATMRQTMGRCLRMQRRTPNMSPLDRFPTKRFVIFDDIRTSRANAPPAGPQVEGGLSDSE